MRLKTIFMLCCLLLYLNGVFAQTDDEGTPNPKLKWGDFWSSWKDNWLNSFYYKKGPDSQGPIDRDTDPRSWPKGITTFLQSSTGGAQSGISTLFYDPQDPTWSQENDGTMATILGGMDRWTQEMCEDKAQNLDSGPNQASIILGAGGSSYAHIEGEKTTVVNNTGTEYLYIVTYGLSAYECDMTVEIYLDDMKIAGPFKLEKPDTSPDADEDKEKKKNSSKSGQYINYSASSYSEACIKFEEDPWCLVGLDGKEICNKFTEAKEQDDDIPSGEDMWPFS